MFSFQSEPVEFEGTDEDQIQNTPVGEPTMLKCQVNQPISFCSWIMPHGAVLSKSQGRYRLLSLITSKRKCTVRSKTAHIIRRHNLTDSVFPENDNQNRSKHLTGEYRIEGDFSEGNCSLALQEVKPHDEGNWRCVVRVRPSGEDVNGPLLHLHMTEHHLPRQGQCLLLRCALRGLHLSLLSADEMTEVQSIIHFNIFL